MTSRTPRAVGTLAGLVVAGLSAVAVGLGSAAAVESAPHRAVPRDSDCTSASNLGRGRQALDVAAITADNRLLCFNEYQPDKARTVGTISGLTGDLRLVGIDYRPATGELFGLGNAGGVYVVDPATAIATKHAQLTVALSGTSFGIDFNPTVDRLRVVSDSGQSLRIDVSTGAAAVDGAVNYTAGTAAAGVAGVAYTNNDADPNTGTTLYDIDVMLDQIAIQAPPNAGTLNVTGKLGLDASSDVGADIYSTVRGGTTVDITAYASLTTVSQSGFYKLALFSGKAIKVGAFPAGSQIVGIAVPLNQR